VLQALRYNRHLTALEPCAALVFSVRESRFQQHFPGLVPTPGAEAEAAGLGPFTQPGRTFHGGLRLSSCGSPRQQENWAAGGNASFCAIGQDGRPSVAVGAGILQLDPGFARQLCKTLGFLDPVEARSPPARAGRMPWLAQRRRTKVFASRALAGGGVDHTSTVAKLVALRAVPSARFVVSRSLRFTDQTGREALHTAHR